MFRIEPHPFHLLDPKNAPHPRSNLGRDTIGKRKANNGYSQDSSLSEAHSEFTTDVDFDDEPEYFTRFGEQNKRIVRTAVYMKHNCVRNWHWKEEVRARDICEACETILLAVNSRHQEMIVEVENLKSALADVIKESRNKEAFVLICKEDRLSVRHIGQEFYMDIRIQGFDP
eukprot:3027431-Amphidinium_carterae.2